MIKNISNLGDAAIYCNFGDQVNKKINSEVINYFNSIKNSKIQGIINLAPSYNKLVISFDLNITNYKKIVDEIKSIKIEDSNLITKKTINIPICCEDGFELDLNNLKENLKLDKEEILNNFFKKEYFCYMNGFVAGMPFMGDIDLSLRTKRLKTPRVKVPKGSVGITEQFCNIYTFESPGGWNIIGKTPLQIFNKENKITPSIINPGNLVKFVRISEKDFYDWK
tara:strand:+ start:12 stop:683 length:672 start_codon:yes stop_codon:yes gene_type:complete